MLKLIGFFYLISSISFANPCPKSSESWFLCQKDSDCIIVPNECGYATAINKEHKSAASKRYKCLGPRVSCVRLKSNPVKAVCKIGVCTTESALKYIETH